MALWTSKTHVVLLYNGSTHFTGTGNFFILETCNTFTLYSLIELFSNSLKSYQTFLVLYHYIKQTLSNSLKPSLTFCNSKAKLIEPFQTILNHLKHILNNFVCFFFLVTVIDKKLAQKAEGERYLKLKTGISEVKRQEKAETEKMKNEMVDIIKEMQQKINRVWAELEEERIEIENIGSDIMELILEMECCGINKEERMKIEEKKT